MSSINAKPKVVILGGGIASLASAFELTDRSDWRDRFESISVYQLGWRLGGKGASGRNREHGGRIEEHGLHVWPGFYDNAFQMMRRCYDELARPATAPLARWDEAFKPQNFIVVEEQVAGQWKPWGFQAPSNALLPGDATGLPSTWDYVSGALDLMVNWFHQAVAELGLPPISTPGGWPFDAGLLALERASAAVRFDNWSQSLREVRLGRWFSQTLGGAAEGGDKVMMDIAREIASRPVQRTEPRPRQDQELMLWLAGRAMDWLASQLPELAALGDRLRHLWIQLDFAYTMLRGAIADGVLENGFDGIDGETFVSWLRRHGASQLTLDSALLRGLHDFVFAQENGDPSRPNLAAGVALRLILRMTFTYKGAVMWKMQAGMGDVVFAPLYQVLQARGVQFEFFHRVNALTLAEDGQSIAQIRLGRQATLRNGTYAPLIEVGGLPCWPNQPRYDQLIEGDQLQTRHVNLESIWTDWPDVNEVTLASGREFDIVVLGISLAALRDTCSELLRANPSWRDMLDRVATVQTQAAQLWFTPTLSQTGWPLPSPILTGYSGPLETWADMSQTLAHEDWPNGGRPGSVAYFCATLPDAGPSPPPGPSPFPQVQAKAVHDATIAALRSQARPLFPAACEAGSGALRWDQLHDASGGSGVARFEAQYWRANVEPTERYVQSLAGTTRDRLSPDQSGFHNLSLAGDWTQNGLNVGCIEAAVISGRRAARARSNDVRAIVGESDLATNAIGRPRKIVVLGGSMAALAAVFELTSRPRWKEEFSEISVYQPGWRLGAEAATGREGEIGAPAKERDRWLWPGIDDNAFRLVRQCYEQLGRAHGEDPGAWQSAFRRHDFSRADEALFPPPAPVKSPTPNDNVPGAAGRRTSPWDDVAQSLKLVQAWYNELSTEAARGPREVAEQLQTSAGEWVRYAAAYTSHLDGAIRKTGASAALVQTASDILDQTRRSLTAYVKSLSAADDRVRQLWIRLDFTLTAVRGALRDQVPLEGFDVLDDIDFRTWLERHGASPITLRSDFLRRVYDLALSPFQGDPNEQYLAAGVALRLVCRLALADPGAARWKMEVGREDAVFAPLYEILRQRGVQFHFFHSVREVRLNRDGTRVAEIRLERQATCRREYEPLITVNGLGRWPDAPRYEFLTEGDALQKRLINLESARPAGEPVEIRRLRARRDFDVVVLGIPLAAIRHSCAGLIAADPRWRVIARNVEPVPGSTRGRLSSGRAWFGNLFVCGDWTRTRLNVSGAESSVLSGLQAAAALRGRPIPRELRRDW